MRTLLQEICHNLHHRRLATGGWSFLLNSTQAAVEPTCLALLALAWEIPSRSVEPVTFFGHAFGSGMAFEWDEDETGLTGLLLLTLDTISPRHEMHQSAARWLIQTRGQEAHWLWRWKFRTTDTRVHFDPRKFGWPWRPGTCSWVVPTAFAVLALKQTARNQHCGKAARRIRRGVEMLLDRACPGGGWNAGNGIVYGHPMSPHIDTTAIALLALRTEPRNAIMESSLDWLKRQANSCRALWSLSWAILALDAYNEPVDALEQRLAALVKPDRISDNATLAVVALALECPTRGNIFEVST